MGRKESNHVSRKKKRTLDGFSFLVYPLSHVDPKVNLFTFFLELSRKSLVMTLNQSTEAVFCSSIFALGQVPNSVK